MLIYGMSFVPFSSLQFVSVPLYYMTAAKKTLRFIQLYLSIVSSFFADAAVNTTSSSISISQGLVKTVSSSIRTSQGLVNTDSSTSTSTIQLVCLEAGLYLPSFTTSPAAQACALCPAGRYCPADGSSLAILCPAGSYCPAEGSILPIACPAGSYCPAEGSISPIACPLGQFQQQKQQAACISCPENYECLASAGTVNPVPCPTGRTSASGSPQGCSPECNYENYYLDKGTQLCKARTVVCNLDTQYEVASLLNRTQERVCRALTACSRSSIRLKERSPVDGGP